MKAAEIQQVDVVIVVDIKHQPVFLIRAFPSRLFSMSAKSNLEGLNIRSLTLRGGKGETTVILPSQATDLTLDVQGGDGKLIISLPTDATELRLDTITVLGGAGPITIELPAYGNFDVQVTSNISDIRIEVPAELEAQLEIVGMANLDIRTSRFTQSNGGNWVTPGYASASERAHIQINAILGSVTITD